MNSGSIDQYYEKMESCIDPNILFNEFFNKCKEIIVSAPKQYQDLLYEKLANMMLDSFAFGRLSYPSNISSIPEFIGYSNTVAKLDVNEPLTDIFRAVELLLRGKNGLVLEKINSWLNAKMLILSEKNDEFYCSDLIYSLVLPLKKGFPGLWNSIGELLNRNGVEKGLTKMCFALEKVYYCDDNDEIISALGLVLIENDNIYLARELLGYTYYNMNMWANSIAYFEQLEDDEDSIHIFFIDMIFFFMAWCYGNLKNYKNEELYYRKAYEINQEAEFVLNNLGYSLYKQKKYKEAKEIFEQCIEQKRDGRFALNNLGRTLIALNEKSEAQKLLKEHPNMSKSIKNRLEKFVTQGKLKEPVIIVESEEEKVQQFSIELGVKKHQFSSERILEDELAMRMESGVNVFGPPLKILRKHGMYGRQYVIPVGRMDILAVDDDKNLYVIELKKDSGYGDAYTQTVRYIEWLSDNLVDKGKKVYGIICLNSPTEALISQVKQDHRVRLYEYSISYREID